MLVQHAKLAAARGGQFRQQVDKLGMHARWAALIEILLQQVLNRQVGNALHRLFVAALGAALGILFFPGIPGLANARRQCSRGQRFEQVIHAAVEHSGVDILKITVAADH